MPFAWRRRCRTSADAGSSSTTTTLVAFVGAPGGIVTARSFIRPTPSAPRRGGGAEPPEVGQRDALCATHVDSAQKHHALRHAGHFALQGHQGHSRSVLI